MNIEDLDALEERILSKLDTHGRELAKAKLVCKSHHDLTMGQRYGLMQAAILVRGVFESERIFPADKGDDE